MSSKIEKEKEWLQSVVIPKMFENGSFTENTPRTIEFNDLCIKQIEIKYIGTEEAFMLTNCYRATVDYDIKGQQGKQHLVVKKTPPVPEEVFDGINFDALFSNEIVAYTKLKPAFEHFTKQKFEVPNYFYSDLQRYSATMVLDDFSTKGWRVPKDRYDLSLEHILSAVKFLADFHGTGFAMREVKRKEFEDIASQLRESRYDSVVPDDWLLSQTQGIQRLLKTTRQYHAEVDEQFLRKFEKLLGNGYIYGKQRVVPVEPFITLCHGDFLRNNIAFRYILKDGIEKPTDVMMFDLQTMRVSSPMVDMTFLLMLSAFAEVRYKNIELILETYRNQLCKTYEKLTKQTAPEYFSFQSFIKEYIRYMPLGSQIGSFFLMNLVEPPEVSPDGFLMDERTPENIVSDLMIRGGETVDRELAHQIKELYELTLKYGVDIAEGIRVDA